jgi:hypothetical protein
MYIHICINRLEKRMHALILAKHMWIFLSLNLIFQFTNGCLSFKIKKLIVFRNLTFIYILCSKDPICILGILIICCQIDWILPYEISNQCKKNTIMIVNQP